MSTQPIDQMRPNEDRAELNRILSFSDGVFAIAITLLAFGMELPGNMDPQTLGSEILRLLPQFGIYGLSFLIIGDAWVIHHRIFRNIVRYDRGLIWLNLLFLLCVAFLPVPSRIFGQYPTERSSIIFFSGCMIVTGIFQSFIWRYASNHHRLLNSAFNSRLILWGKIRGLIPITVQTLSIAIALFNPVWAILSWGLIWVGFALLDRYYPRA